MLKIIFKKQIHACFASSSSNDIYLEKIIEMPFIPTVGMEVSDGDWGCIVESLCYADGKIYAFTNADMELYDAGLPEMYALKKKKRTVQEIAQEYIALGWEISKGVLCSE